MRTTVVTAVFGLLLVTTFAIGGKEGPEPLSPSNATPKGAEAADAAIKKMIEDLASDDWRTREKAGLDLATKGDKALPHMRAAMLATDSPEVQRRLAVLVRKLDRDRLVEPRRVTLSAKDQTPKQIFDEIAKQSGYRIEFGGGGPEGKYSFEFDKTPFWQAVDAVANAAGFTVYAEYDDDTIRVYAQDTMNPHVAYAGPFRFLATNINTSRSLQLSGISKREGTPRVNEYMNLSFQVQSEPKNPMLGMMMPELTEARDDLGGSLLPPQERNGYRSGYYSGGYRGHNTYMSVNLVRGDRAATTLKSLKGKVSVVLLSGTVPDIVVTDALKVKKKSFAGRTVGIDVESIEEDANQKGVYVVSLVAKRVTPVDPNRGEDYGWSNNLWQRMELTDEKGNKYFCYGPSTHNNDGGSVRLTVQFGSQDRRTGRPGPSLGVPTKLTITEWQTITHEVSFAFKDIPLP
ncbi:MAG: hypothetical protein J0I06_03370 [Planctomycetes bacterium]|nr:hypothetical protein [Planctomycetota bacterium]